MIAYKKKDDQLKPLGSAVVTRGAAFVRLPWKRAPHGRTKVLVCYQGSDVVAPELLALAPSCTAA